MFIVNYRPIMTKKLKERIWMQVICREPEMICLPDVEKNKIIFDEYRRIYPVNKLNDSDNQRVPIIGAAI